MISPQSVARIEASQGWRASRVEIFKLPEGKVVVKAQRPARSAWPHRLMNMLTSLARVPYLRAVPVHGGARSQKIEITRLQALAASGLPVPKVQHVGADYFVMSFVGSRDLALTLREQGSGAFKIWVQGMEQLLRVHSQGQYLSQCVARNIIVSDTVDGLIDFEDDPLEVMGLVEAQARDWLIYLHSTLLNLAADSTLVDEAIASALAREPMPVRAVLRHAAKRLAWLRCLPTNRKVWGKDFVSLQVVAAALYRHHMSETDPITETL